MDLAFDDMYGWLVCELIEVDWLAACIALSGWRCIGRFPPALA
jgi:hypothetical protein